MPSCYGFATRWALAVFFFALLGCAPHRPTGQADPVGVVLKDQYGQKRTFGNDEHGVWVIGHADIPRGTEVVRWTRALRRELGDDVVAGILEFPRGYSGVHGPLKRHVATKHLRGAFTNPYIEDLEAGERHPTLFLDWHQQLAPMMGRDTAEVWVVVFDEGSPVRALEGAYSTDAMAEVLAAVRPGGVSPSRCPR